MRFPTVLRSKTVALVGALAGASQNAAASKATFCEGQSCARRSGSHCWGKLPKTNYSIFALQKLRGTAKPNVEKRKVGIAVPRTQIFSRWLKQRGTVVQMSHGGLVAFLLYVNQEKNVIMFQFLKNAIAGVRFCPQRPQCFLYGNFEKLQFFEVLTFKISSSVG